MDDYERITVEVLPDGRFEPWHQTSVRSRWGLGKITLDELKLLDEQVSRILRPTSDQVYESTLDNLFDGESDGDVESPVGWFAIVNWPNGHTYLISRDSLGFSHFLGSTDHRTPVCLPKEELKAHYEKLAEQFSEWNDE